MHERNVPKPCTYNVHRMYILMFILMYILMYIPKCIFMYDHVMHIKKESTFGWKAHLDGKHNRMESTIGWKAQSDEKHNRMENTIGWQAQSDGKHNRMESAIGWKAHLIESTIELDAYSF